MLGRPLPEVLAEIKLDGEIGSVLLDKAATGNRLASVYSLMRQYEAADWESLATTADQLNISRNSVPELYLGAVAWPEQIFRC